MLITGELKPNFLGIDWDRREIFEGAKEITKDEYLMLRTNISAIGFTQLKPPGYDKVHHITLQFSQHDGKASCMCRRLADDTKFPKELRDNRLCIELHTGILSAHDEVVFFSLGCQHKKLQYKKIRMFEREWYCPDCGWSNRFDSSG